MCLTWRIAVACTRYTDVMPRMIRASEIGSHLYCRRAWWYRQDWPLLGSKGASEVILLAGQRYPYRDARLRVDKAACCLALTEGNRPGSV